MLSHLREVAIDDLIDIGGEMVEELAELIENQPDGFGVNYARELIDRWTNTVKVVHQEGAE